MRAEIDPSSVVAGRVAWPWFVVRGGDARWRGRTDSPHRYGRVLEDWLDATSGRSRLLGVGAFTVAGWLFVQYSEPSPVAVNSFLAGAMGAIVCVTVVEQYVA